MPTGLRFDSLGARLALDSVRACRPQSRPHPNRNARGRIHGRCARHMIRKVHLDRGNGTPWCFVKAKAYAFGDEATSNCEICLKQRETAPGTNQMLVCAHCREKKPGSEFHTDKKHASGKHSICKSCRTIQLHNERPSNREANRSRAQRYRANHPERPISNALRNDAAKPKTAYARQVVRNEVKRGRMIRKPCEVCGESYTHGHHDDYDKPLTVRWLCPVHHTEWHEINGLGANIEGEPIHIGRR